MAVTQHLKSAVSKNSLSEDSMFHTGNHSLESYLTVNTLNAFSLSFFMDPVIVSVFVCGPNNDKWAAVSYRWRSRVRINRCWLQPARCSWESRSPKSLRSPWRRWRDTSGRSSPTSLWRWRSDGRSCLCSVLCQIASLTVKAHKDTRPTWSTDA